MEFFELYMPNSGTSWPENETLFNMKDGWGEAFHIPSPDSDGPHSNDQKMFTIAQIHNTHGREIYLIKYCNIFPSVWNCRLARRCTCGKLWTRVRGSTYTHYNSVMQECTQRL